MKQTLTKSTQTLGPQNGMITSPGPIGQGRIGNYCKLANGTIANAASRKGGSLCQL